MPLFTNPDAELCKFVAKVSYEAGIRVFEFASRTDNAPEVFTALRKYADEYLPELIIGVGTIITVKDAQKYLALGAEFIVAPMLSEEVGKFCRENDIFWCPGASTLSEIVRAHDLGADLVKIFPAETLGGPAFIKAIKAPCPWINVMPTGGVTTAEENLKGWFATGISCVGIGSNLFSKDILASPEKTKERVVTLLETIKKVRNA
ncbi:2-dehydro-3-deoxyphosphogluconate aldolase / (4S)-4-hydroxy-2-oxoglutarate aldolase [Pseudarcicella hirudinis]|uniref:2-dehydro-3-deoxyphosphogluconate aldolase / (4S)-4-hydroxy-2-oxoglutarate aldolase n=2 Tax=Pseudarcicella hirudinis TaxID=1079859 RepID=A0A1I5XDA0_9BACT|nr:2-dehydro-3-deoxyphosphogluconate aldolase / (4S)-4-hydroxy-2-oxoglutarate aldolase [Pseudarcicella hirudinis]